MNGSPDSYLNIDLGAAAAAFGAGGGQLTEKKDGTVEDVDLQAAGATVDFQGALALIRGLTFEAMHPELVLPPASMPEMEEPAAPAPVIEGELPDWLKPTEEAAPLAGAEPPVEETAEPAPLPEEQPPAPSGPTEEEAAAGLVAAEAARPGTKVYDVEKEEVVIPPAREEDSMAVEAGAKKGLAEWLKKIDFRKLARESSRYLIPSLTGVALGRLLPPEQALNLTQTAFAVGMLGFIGSGGCAVMERVLSGHPRAAGIAQLLAAGKVAGAVFAETGMLMAAGSFAGGLWHEREIVRQAAAQMGQPEIGGIGRVGGLPPDERSVSPSAPVAGGGEYNPPFTGPNVPMPELPVPVEVLPPAEALQSGKTIGELAEVSGQLPWNVVRESVGGGPHAGEVTNVVTRALQAGGVDISNLHEGAISQLVTKVQGVFDSADKALETFNVGHPYAPRPYDAGGLGAVETVKGLNSPEVQAIRAANLGDMEAARNIFDSVIKSELQPILP